jgi:hypothetical protein
MLSKTPIDRVYLACGRTDLRKSIDGFLFTLSNKYNINIQIETEKTNKKWKFKPLKSNRWYIII